MGMRIGTNTGGSLITTSNTPLKFHTYTSDVSPNIPSIEINGSGNRDVTVFSPLLVSRVFNF